MTVRTSQKTVTFRRPFVLTGFDEILPAGIYVVETDEELLEGISFLSYRRILTLLHLPARSGNPNLTGVLTIDPNELEAALEHDRTSTESTTIGKAGQNALTAPAEQCQEHADHQAIERGEDEGMIVAP